MSDKISLFQNHRVWESLREQILDLVDIEHRQGFAQNGSLNRVLEQRLAEQFGRKHCVTTGTCTDALQIAVTTLDLPLGSRIGVPNYTFTATAHAVHRAGHVPVSIDVDSNYCIDTDGVKDVQAVVNVDLFGNMSNWKKLNQFKIPIINDSAQSLESKDTHSWSVAKGLLSCVSFSPSKPVSSWGSGGALLTDDDELAQQARKLRLHGKISNDTPAIASGLNSMMSSFEVASVVVGLDHAHTWRQRRQQIAEYLIAESNHETAIDLSLPQHTLSKLVFKTEHRADLLQRFQQSNIDCVFHYKILVNDEKIYHQDLYLPVSNHLKQISFTVPNQHTLTDDEVERIAKVLK